MLRYQVRKDYGSHNVLDSVHMTDDEAAVAKGKVVDGYRSAGYDVRHLMTSAAVCSKKDGHRVGPDDGLIPSYHTVIVYTQAADGFPESVEK